MTHIPVELPLNIQEVPGGWEASLPLSWGMHPGFGTSVDEAIANLINPQDALAASTNRHRFVMMLQIILLETYNMTSWQQFIEQVYNPFESGVKNPELSDDDTPPDNVTPFRPKK